MYYIMMCCLLWGCNLPTTPKQEVVTPVNSEHTTHYGERGLSLNILMQIRFEY
jgi:hypothetical protein